MTYKCASCGGVFQDGWTEEDAKSEYMETFGKAVSKSDAVVCDDCYKKIMEEIPLISYEGHKQIFDNYNAIGAAATHTYIDSEGVVRIDVLSISETLNWLERIKNGEELPDGVIIQGLNNDQA